MPTGVCEPSSALPGKSVEMVFLDGDYGKSGAHPLCK
jgi:hypothetical protein